MDRRLREIFRDLCASPLMGAALLVAAVIAVSASLVFPTPLAPKDLATSCSTAPDVPRPLSFDSSRNVHLGGDSSGSHVPVVGSAIANQPARHQSHTPRPLVARRAAIQEFSPLHRRPPPSFS